ncbi:MAG TPA: hypothetical protein VFY39_05155, partial [Gammaproteobacteria bacterium]|nr:hypothetical protein [Gammaproteobacteria bacterium]
ATFALTANAAGTETLAADALGIESKHTVSISSDVFKFTSPQPPPATPLEINLGQDQTVTVNWKKGGTAVANQDVTFSTTRGTLTPLAPVMTDSSGNASVTINANNAGPAVITATNADGTSVQADVEFVATTPTSVELQANPFSVPTNGQSAITAIVRDDNGNLVKNQTVTFVLDDVTGGSLSVAQAVTDSQGRAQTFYNASSTTSAVDGVHIDASIQGATPSVTGSVALTVAQRQVFISLGTGNQIEEPNTAQYKKTWVAQVTDAQGNAVKGVELSFSVLSDYYYEGHREWNATDKKWDTVYTSTECPDEDVNRNGVLDSGEDLNGSKKIEAGNIATAVAGGSSGGTVTTDDSGFALIDLYWPQEYAAYIEVTLEARSPVQGSESEASTTFLLDGLASDFSDQGVPPPGVTSPFGNADCATPPP